MELTIECNPSDPLYLGWRELMGKAATANRYCTTYQQVAELVGQDYKFTVMNVTLILHFCREITLQFESASARDWFVLKCV